MKIPFLQRPERPVIFLIACLGSAFLFDFFSRVLVISDPRPVRGGNLIIEESMDESVEQIRDRLKAWIPFNEAKTVASSTSIESLRLRAVFISRNGSRIIIAAQGPDGQVFRHARLGLGDEFEGWRVIGIEPRKVAVKRGDVVGELFLLKSVKAAVAIGEG